MQHEHEKNNVYVLFLYVVFSEERAHRSHVTKWTVNNIAEKDIKVDINASEFLGLSDW